MLLHYKWPHCCTQSLIQCFHFFFLQSDGCFALKTQNIFIVIFSLFHCRANELSAGRCFPEDSSAIRPVVWGNVFCWICCSEIEQAKITISLISFQFFPLSVSLFWFLGVQRCFPHSAAAANLPRSIVLLASFWTCAAINTVRCFLSEAGLQEDICVTAVFCYAAAHTLKWKRGKSLEVIEPNSYCDKTTTYDLWVKPINNKLHTHAPSLSSLSPVRPTSD